jgi:phosphatidylinositol glycan class K
MELKGRYKEILFIIDTCQASTLAASIDSPGITTIGSSAKGMILNVLLSVFYS